MNLRAGSSFWSLAPALLGLIAVFLVVGVGPALAADAQFGHGSAHIDWTPASGPRGSMDLPLLPVYPPAGTSGDPLSIGSGPYDWGLSKNYQVGPAGAEWDVNGSGYMQFLFADTSKNQGPMLWIFGPAKLGGQTFGSNLSRDVEIILRLPGRPFMAENRSNGLSTECSLTMQGDPTTRIDGSFVCHGMEGILVGGVDTPPATDASGTFSVFAPGVGEGPPLVPIAVAGGGVVGVGGVVVWRRRKKGKGASQPSRPPVKVAPLIPAPCTDIARRLDQTEEAVTTLREAISDVSTTLTRAERIHRNNLIKARMVVNLEIIKTLGQTATDVALAVRPGVLRRAGLEGLGQVDTWKPPVEMDPRLATLIEKMTTAAESAVARVNTLATEFRQATSAVEEAVSEVPAVAAQRAVVADAKTILDQDLQDLAVCGPLRTQLADMEPARQTAAHSLASLYDSQRLLKSQLEEARTQLNMARNQLNVHQGLTARDLAAAEKELADLHAAGVEDTLRLGAAQERVQELQMELSDKMRSSDAQGAAQAVAQAEAKFNKAEANVSAIGTMVSDAETNRGRLHDTADTLRDDILRHHDVYPGDIDKQKQILAAAQQREADLSNQARQGLAGQLSTKEAELYQAELEATQAKAVLSDAREAAAEEARRQATAGKSTESQWTWRYPFQLAGEIIFGVGQSPEEIVEVLRRDIVNIKTMRNQITNMRTSLTQLEATRNTLRSQLAACLSANGVNPDSLLTPDPPTPSGPGVGAPPANVPVGAAPGQQTA